MKGALKLPSCIHATRIGYYPESECDAFGELAPVTWVCNCGRQLTLERYDDETDRYIAVSQERKEEFLAQHTVCTAKCYKCGEKPVTRAGYWCQECEENS